MILYIHKISKFVHSTNTKNFVNQPNYECVYRIYIHTWQLSLMAILPIGWQKEKNIMHLGYIVNLCMPVAYDQDRYYKLGEQS